MECDDVHKITIKFVQIVISEAKLYRINASSISWKILRFLYSTNKQEADYKYEWNIMSLSVLL